jgi:hypothetical protein
MSNKFLPFVVAKSTPLHIYQTLVSRSKGMNEVLIASIFYLVLERGIAEVRKAADELSTMEPTQLYETLIAQSPSYRISNEDFSKIHSITRHLKAWHEENISAELREFDMPDIMSFLLVMQLSGKGEDYTSLRFDNLFNGVAEDAELCLPTWDLFSSDGEDHFFHNIKDLSAYVWCHTVLADRNDQVIPVKAIYYPGAKIPKDNTVPWKEKDNTVPWEEE